MKQPTPELYAKVQAKALAIESELKRLNRWCNQPLPPEKFDNMGAFGSNTMTFEQWLQFMLIPRIKSIVDEKGEFPQESAVATYAHRYFDGYTEAENLHEILYELDQLINGVSQESYQYPDPAFTSGATTGPPLDVTSFHDDKIPSVVNTLAGLLKEFEGDALESQLQTFDTFLAVLSPKVRPAISQLLIDAAQNCQSAVVRARVEKAASDIAKGGRAAEPYDHEKAMKKYMEEHAKGYPKNKPGDVH